jgi:hypothetical protein
MARVSSALSPPPEPPLAHPLLHSSEQLFAFRKSHFKELFAGMKAAAQPMCPRLVRHCSRARAVQAAGLAGLNPTVHVL